MIYHPCTELTHLRVSTPLDIILRKNIKNLRACINLAFQVVYLNVPIIDEWLCRNHRNLIEFTFDCMPSVFFGFYLTLTSWYE